MARRVSLAALGILATLGFLACVEDGGADHGGDLGGAGGQKDPSTPGSNPTLGGEEGLHDVTVLDTDEDQQAGETGGARGIAGPTSPPIVLFLNGRGATMAVGRNDSANNTSRIVKGTTVFPASKYRNDAVKWTRMVSTVRDHYTRYNVTIVDTEPTSGPYLEAVVTSGSPSLIGYGDTLAGIAPAGCGVVATSVAFVFDSRLRDEVHVAEVASHELAHSLSLGHTQTQTDLMSYTSKTPLKFEAIDALCGPAPGKSEPCSCPGTTQNNDQQLRLYVGSANAATPPPPATTTTPPPTSTPPPSTPPAPAASVAILAPANNSTYKPNTALDVRVDGTKVPNLSHMVLRWTIGTTNYEYGCPSTRCTVGNGIYTWRMAPTTGERRFFARATDAKGQVTSSPTFRITSAAP